MSIPKVDFSEFSGWFYCENGRSQKWPQNGSKRPLAMRKRRFKVSSRVGEIFKTDFYSSGRKAAIFFLRRCGGFLCAL